MTVVPYGLPRMMPAWVDFIIFAIGKENILKAFESDTGIKLNSLENASLIEKMIDQQSGRVNEDLNKFLDWVTITQWGLHDAVEPLCSIAD